MNMEATVRLTINIPFNFALNETNEIGHNQSYIEAAQHVENELVNSIKSVVADHGEVVQVLIEEVRETQ